MEYFRVMASCPPPPRGLVYSYRLAGYIELADKFKTKGVDSILCLSVNDCFVMSSWGKQLGAEGKVSRG